MSKSTKGGNQSNKRTTKSQGKQSIPSKIHKQGKLTVKQAQQIATPPIKTTPKKK